MPENEDQIDIPIPDPEVTLPPPTSQLDAEREAAEQE